VLAERYEERSSAPAPSLSSDEAPIFLDAPAPRVEETDSAVPEFSIDEAPAEVSAVEPVADAPEEITVQAASPWPIAQPTAEPEFAVVDEATTQVGDAATSSAEIDLSSEWDDTLTVDADAPVAEVAETEVEPALTAGGHQDSESARFNETVDEIRFYLSHGMPAQAMAALAKLQTFTTDQAKLADLRAEVEAATQGSAEDETPVAAEPVVEEITVEDVPSIEVVEDVPVEDVPVAVEEPVAVEPEPPAIAEIPVVAEAPVKPVPPPSRVVHHHAPEPEPEPEPSVLQGFVSDLESSLGDTFLPGTVAKPAEAAPAAAAYAEPAVAAARPAPVLGEFVADIESSLGEDFLKAAPVAEPQRPVARAVPVPAKPAIPAAPQVAPMAASAAASAAPSSHSASPAAHAVPHMPVVAPAAPVAPPVAPAAIRTAPVLDVPKPQPPAIPAPHAPSAAAKASPFAEEAGVDLAEMFGELKHDLEAGVAASDEDPETHYNLGIAFREMGLLDEAIGELQKACQSFDRGHSFPQIMQTYTWLAQCFLEKAVPEAAVRWYDKALNVVGIDGETRVALNYELASAYEASGDKPSALKHFMEVYGTNIDYRDVAERIKALKS
jgi:hypothetical protein